MYSMPIHNYYLKNCTIILGDIMTKFKRNFNFNENIIEVIAYNVRKYRKISGITQEQLAIDIDVTPEFIRKFESTRGSEGLSLMSLYKISIVLNVSMDKFFEDIDETNVQ